MNCLKCTELLSKGSQFCEKCGAAVKIPPADAYVGLIKDCTENFTGRDWVFRKINDWLEASGPPIYVFKGGPGSGKTAVSARLVQMSHGTVQSSDYPCLKTRLTFVHFCQAQVPTSRDPRRFVEALSKTLAHLYQPYAQALVELPTRQIIVNQSVGKAEGGSRITGAIIHVDNVQVGKLSSIVAFDEAVRKPLEQLCGTDFDETLVILVDALDEAWSYDPDDNIATLLGQATRLPRQVRFLLTTRPDEEVLHAVQTPALDLIADAPDYEDIRLYAYQRLEALSEFRRTALARRIAKVSEGNFLYARYVLNDLPPNADQVDDFSLLPLPNGLDGIYRQFLERNIAQALKQWSQYRPLLGAIAVAQGQGMNRSQLAGVMAYFKHLSVDDTSDFLRACSQYLAGPQPEGPFRIYHQSFRDFLLKDAKYQIFPPQANRSIGEFFIDTYQGEAWLDCQDNYALQYTETHLQEAVKQMSLPEQRLARQEVEEKLTVLQANRTFRLARSLRFGRAWVFRRLNDWLAANGPQVFLLTGEPGSGKTTLAKQLVEMSAGKGLSNSYDYPHLSPGFLVYAHFCNASSLSTVDPRKFSEALYQALVRRSDIFRSRLTEPSEKQIKISFEQKVELGESGGKIVGVEIDQLDLSRPSARAEFDQKVCQPLRQLCTADFKEQLVILVDALDEALPLGPQEGIVDMLGEAIQTCNLPPQVRFLLISRLDPRIITLLGKPSLDLRADIPNASGNVDDVAAYVYSRIEKLELPRLDRVNLAYRVAEVSQDNFLYASFASEEVLVHPESINTISDVMNLELPQELAAVFENFIDKELGRDTKLWCKRYQPFFGALAVARGEGLTKKQLAGVTQFGVAETDELILRCEQFLIGTEPDGPYRLFHESFRNFLLTSKISGNYYNKYFIDAIAANQAVATYLVVEHGGKWDQCRDDYALQNTAAHLMAALSSADPSERIWQKIKDSLVALLTDISFLEARAQRFDLEAALSDVRYAILYLLNQDAETQALLNDVAAKVSSRFLGQKMEMSQSETLQPGSAVTGVEIRNVKWDSEV